MFVLESISPFFTTVYARPIGLYCIARMATFVGVLRKGISVAITRSTALFLPRT